ncbi:MAG: type II secretion system F family protein [Pseudomonadota bacterium]
MSKLDLSQDLIYVVYIGIALGVFLLFTGFVQLVSRKEQLGEAKSRRMKMIAKGRSTAEILEILKPEAKKGPLSGLPIIGTFDRDLHHAGIAMRVRVFFMLCMVGALLLFVMAAQILTVIQAVFLALLVGFVIPIIVVKARRKEREKKLVTQLPDALDLMARGLRVGHPLNTSINAVAEELQDPIASEFGIMFDQVSFGDDLTDAFTEFAERFEVEDVQYLAASVGIQHGTGGDLARVLQTLASVIRGRISMRRRIQAISSEGRLTAYFLSALPFAIYFGTSLMSPTYYSGVSDDPLYMPMMLMIAGFTVANALILRRLVNFSF